MRSKDDVVGPIELKEAFVKVIISSGLATSDITGLTHE